MVEHHGYFRNGYEDFKKFVEQLNGLDERLEWASLATLCSRACRSRIAADGDVHVRFYTSRFQFVNSGGQNTETLSLLAAAKVSGGPRFAHGNREWPCLRAQEQKDGSLLIPMSLEAGADELISRILSDDLQAAREFFAGNTGGGLQCESVCAPRPL